MIFMKNKKNVKKTFFFIVVSEIEILEITKISENVEHFENFTSIIYTTFENPEFSTTFWNFLENLKNFKFPISKKYKKNIFSNFFCVFHKKDANTVQPT